MKKPVYVAAIGISFLSAFASGTEETMPFRIFPGIVSTEKNELNFQLTDNEETAVFTRAEADYTHGKIYLVDMEDGDISAIETIEFSDPLYKDSDPWLSPSGADLYFISNRPAFRGDVRENHADYDIWRSRKVGVNWTAPEHMNSVNSLAGEFGPEINNGYLYFSSVREGKYNIYRSRMLTEGFAEPEKLGAPLNTVHDDSDFTMTKDGQVALWWSRRPGGMGSGDLYVSRKADAGWGEATNLGPKVNTPYLDFTPSLSPNNAILYFATSRPFPGQDEGAADVYKVPTKDIPALQSALSQNALMQLKKAFGGDQVLSTVKSISYRLQFDSAATGMRSTDYYINFSESAIMETDVGTGISRAASINADSQAASEHDSNLSRSDRNDLLSVMTANFLYYLTASDLKLLGPEDIKGHGNLTWFRMNARGNVSPLVGLDPVTGRIIKVLGSDRRAVVVELDYLADETGLVWPYRFIVQHPDGKTSNGKFLNLSINPQPPHNVPIQFSETSRLPVCCH